MGKTKYLIDELIRKRANGDTFLELDIQMKLLLKGINVKHITDATPDDAEVIEKIYEMAGRFNISLETI